MVNSRCRDGGPAFPAIISSVQSKEAPDRPCLAFAKLEPTFFCSDQVVFARYSDFRYLVVWVWTGISQWYRVGDAGALRAEPLATLCLARS